MANSPAKRPVLRMADGGLAIIPNLAGSLRGWITGAGNPQRQAGLAEAGMAAPLRNAPVAPPAPPTPLAPSGDPSRRTATNPAGLRFASGGPVRGAGSGTSDSIPARLSDGEYVLPADTVRARIRSSSSITTTGSS